MAGPIFIATTGDGIARATQDARNNGGRWQVENLLPGTDVRCLSVDPLDTSRVYAGTQGAGVLRSDDGGRTPALFGPAGACCQRDSGKSPSARRVVRGHQASSRVHFEGRRGPLDRACRFQAHPLAVAVVLACREAVHRLRAGNCSLPHRPGAHSCRYRIRRDCA
jgi:hypothetical protein